MTVTINEETLQDVINIETGLLAPLTGFMGAEDFRDVVDRCRLADGRVFPLPITLDVPPEQFEQIRPAHKARERGQQARFDIDDVLKRLLIDGDSHSAVLPYWY